VRKRAKEGMLEELLTLAIPTCQQAERLHPRHGPGAKPQVPDWVLAVMILAGVLLRKKTKTDQYHFWCERPQVFARCLPGQRLPGRSSFFARYARVYPLVQTAVRLQGELAIERGWANPTVVAVDKSLIAARGRRFRTARRRDGQLPRVPRGADRDARWGFCTHDGWVQGYSYEALVTAPRRGGGPTWPLLASADAANLNERKSLAEKIPLLHERVQVVTADAGYDANALAEAIEWHTPTPGKRARRTGRRFLCPQVRRRPPAGARPRQTLERQQHRRLREARQRYLRSPAGRRLFARRKVRSEPFNSHLKSLFELEDRVWLWGLPNNRTVLETAVFAYQILLTYNHLNRRPNARVKWLLHRL